MKLYGMELMKIKKKKSTWIVMFFLMLEIVIFWKIEPGFVSNIRTDFGQLSGYKRFLDLSELFIVCAIIGEIIVLAPFFCEDKENKMDTLIKTSKKGRLHDYVSRVCVIFTLILCLNLFMMITAYIICNVIYGYSGENLPLKEMYVFAPLMAEKKISFFISIYLLNIVNASIMLSALIAFISSMSKKSVHSLMVIFFVVFLPAFLEGIFKTGDMNVGYVFLTGQPIMLITSRCVEQSYSVYSWHIFMVYAISIVFSFIGGKQWCSSLKE